jgi:hypothetical protein
MGFYAILIRNRLDSLPANGDFLAGILQTVGQKNIFFKKRTGEVIENKGSARKTKRKRTETNLKTKRRSY